MHRGVHRHFDAKPGARQRHHGHDHRTRGSEHRRGGGDGGRAHASLVYLVHWSIHRSIHWSTGPFIRSTQGARLQLRCTRGVVHGQTLAVRPVRVNSHTSWPSIPGLKRLKRTSLIIRNRVVSVHVPDRRQVRQRRRPAHGAESASPAEGLISLDALLTGHSLPVSIIPRGGGGWSIVRSIAFIRALNRFKRPFSNCGTVRLSPNP